MFQRKTNRETQFARMKTSQLALKMGFHRGAIGIIGRAPGPTKEPSKTAMPKTLRSPENV